jgi:dihydroorotate dehydrogenase
MRVVASIVSLIYRYLLKPILFQINPEAIHDHAVVVGRLVSNHTVLRRTVKYICSYKNNKLVQEIFGKTFPNPIGLSAGFDKDAMLLKILPAVGFGFAEIGSVTLHPYEGNTPPRLYRLIKTGGIVVNYGLKNSGIKAIIPRLTAYYPGKIPLNISIAKTNCQATANEICGIDDYATTLKILLAAQVGDIYTLNISCPNAFGGEPFTNPNSLERLLSQIDSIQSSRPIFLKMPIDLPWKEFKSLLDIAAKHNIQGVTIGNLTKKRENIKDVLPDHIKGGISGLLTQKSSNKLISHTFKTYGNRFVIIGVGGVFSSEDAYEKIKCGASLVELITGMIFQGPQLIGQINHGLIKLLQQDGYSHISEAVGAYHKTP